MDMEEQEVSSFVGAAGSMQNGTALEIVWWWKLISSDHTIQQSCSLVFIQRSWNMSTQNLHRKVYRSFVHNCHDLEAAKMAFSSWIWLSKLVYPDRGILPLKRNYFSSQERTSGGTLNAKWRKSVWKATIWLQLYDILKNCRDRKRSKIARC